MFSLILAEDEQAIHHVNVVRHNAFAKYILTIKANHTALDQMFSAVEHNVNQFFAGRALIKSVYMSLGFLYIHSIQGFKLFLSGDRKGDVLLNTSQSQRTNLHFTGWLKLCHINRR
jgi:hypothetical protein